MYCNLELNKHTNSRDIIIFTNVCTIIYSLTKNATNNKVSLLNNKNNDFLEVLNSTANKYIGENLEKIVFILDNCPIHRSHFIQNFIGGQTVEIIIEEIPNEKSKVKCSIGFAIPGIEPTTGTITGNLLTYENPEQTITLPQIGEIIIKNSGQLVAGDDPNKLTGEISLNINFQGLPIATICTFTAIRKL